MLFNDGATKMQSAYIYTVTPSNRMTMECWVMHGETCENPITISYNWSHAITFATRLFHRLTLL